MEGIEIIEKEKTPKGGKREGSGRKPSIDLLATKEVKTRIAELWVDLCDQYAIPYYVGVMQGTEEVSPDIKFKVGNDILNRALGKPKERHEHSGPDGEAIKTENLNGPEVDKIRSQYEAELKKLIIK